MPIDLSREQTFEAFNYEQDLRMKCISILEETKSKEQLCEEDEVQKCLLKDRMWQQLGIEQEDYNLAMTKYKLEEDEHVLMRVEEVEKFIS